MSTPNKALIDGILPPGWLLKYGRFHSEHACVVQLDERGNHVVELGGQVLTLKHCQLAAGAEVLVWMGWDGFFLYDTAQEIAARKAEQLAQEERKALELKNSLNAQRQRDETFNARIKLPVAWEVGQKDALSGLSERSFGGGRSKSTVEHILLLEELVDGRFKRAKGDFLCTSASGSNGRRWASTAVWATDGNGAAYAPAVNCKACLKAAKRWTAESSD